jgi:hypothetical protein
MNKPCKICPNPIKKKTNTFCSRKCAVIFNKPIPPHGTGKECPNWKGGKIDRSGYIFVHRPDHPFAGKQGYIAEHRLVMEGVIGRFLLPGEVVHHINEVKTDNRPENLKLFASPGKHCLEEHIYALEMAWKINKGRIPWNKKK